ncbi:MAG: hypothetical protein AAGI01_09985, partial [Myxococcota bacterium]
MFERTARALLALSLSCFIVACGAENNSENNSENNDSTNDDAMDMAAVEQGNTTPVDMNSGNNTTEDMPADEGTGTEEPEDMGRVDMAPEDMGEEDMAPEDMGEEDMAPEDMGATSGYGPGTFFNSFVVDATCCVDFDNDGVNDNAVGAFFLPQIQLAEVFTSDVQASINAEIDAGQLVYLLEFSDWDNALNDESLNAHFLIGADDDSDFSGNLNGTGGFHVNPESFDAQGNPLYKFASVQVTNGRLEATGGM